MELVEELRYSAMLEPPLDVGGGRMFFEVTGGSVSGARVNGEVLPGGGDWALIGTDGVARVDVRIQLRTADGAAIYVQYHGILELSAAVAEVLAGTRDGTDYGDQYFRTAPRFETGDERYAWLNRSVFVAEGHLLPGFGVEYVVYRVA